MQGVCAVGVYTAEVVVGSKVVVGLQEVYTMVDVVGVVTVIVVVGDAQEVFIRDVVKHKTELKSATACVGIIFGSVGCLVKSVGGS